MKNLINGQKPEFGNLEHIKVVQKEENDRREKKESEDFLKSLSPQARAFQAFVEVDFAIGIIQHLTKKITAHFNGRSPIEIMFDKGTGYDKGIIKWFLLKLQEAYEHMIPNFKLMGEEEREKEYKGLLDNINEALNGKYKKVKPVELPEK